MNAAQLIDNMANAVSTLRQVLEQERVDDYGSVIESAQRALDAINNYPGGSESLRDEIDCMAEEEKLRLRELIIKASQDHDINGELIRLAAQKNAALQAVVAQQAASATYSDRGQVPGVMGSLLSRKA